MTTGLWIGKDGSVHVHVAPSRLTSGLATFMAATTLLLLSVMLAVRQDDPFAAVAIACGLVVTAGVGAVVAARQPDHPCGWLLGTLCIVAAIAIAGTDYVQSSLASPERYPWTVAVGWVTTWIAFPAVAMGALVLLTFPTGRLSSPRWRAAAVGVVVASAAAACSAALMPGRLPIADALDNPIGVRGAGDVLEALNTLATITAALVLIAAVARLVGRFRRVHGRERDQLKILAHALPIAFVGILATAVASGPLDEASFYFAVAGLTAIPVAIGWAVLRHQLFDIEVLVSRALVYGSLTVVVGALYVGIVVGLGRVFDRSGEFGLPIIATAIVAVVLGPLREQFQRTADRVMYGDRADPYAALARLGHQLEGAAEHGDLLPLTAETVGRSLKLRAVTISVLRDGSSRAAAAWGDPGRDESAEVFDLVHGRELVGQLAVWPRSAETLAGRDRLLLADLCRSVALVTHADTIHSELQESRRQLVTAQEEERRHLRADLHDGLGPELAGVVFGLGAARNTVQRDPAAAEALIAELQEQVRSAVTQVRSLVDGLAPTVEQLGLGGAVREGAKRLGESAELETIIDVPEALPALPAAVEVAAYRIVMEAVTNAARHAHASRCSVVVRVEDGLCVEVTDDGRGLPATVVPGVGLSSMRQRAEELGGWCAIEPAPGGGTRVTAGFPTT